ncbi:MAG: signal peptidase II [Thermodesulfobacteriota bacterium]
MAFGRRLTLWTLIALAVVVLDQASKWLAVAALADGGMVLIPGLADLVLVYNKGAAFGILADSPHGRWLLVGLTVVALALAAWLAVGGRSGGRPGMLTCISLISGGAVGNLIDRVRIGQVIDFLYLHAGQYYWPAFNLADAAITCGGAGLAWLLWRGERPGPTG